MSYADRLTDIRLEHIYFCAVNSFDWIYQVIFEVSEKSPFARPVVLSLVPR